MFSNYQTKTLKNSKKFTSHVNKQYLALTESIEELQLLYSTLKKNIEGKPLCIKKYYNEYATLFAITKKLIYISENITLFDEQIQAGYCLLTKSISEMQTGEGKTLAALAPLLIASTCSLNKGVHLVTANSYLAKRDALLASKILSPINITVGYLSEEIPHSERHPIYNKDIVYGTASDFGFDYLRDNGLSFLKEHRVQASHFFTIIDEADSILIDEAKTPLIISGQPDEEDNTVIIFEENLPRVKELINYQTQLIKSKIKKMQDIISSPNFSNNEDHTEISELLYQIHVGDPKNKHFLKQLQDPSIKSLLNQVMEQSILDSNEKTFNKLKADLYFCINFKFREVEITDKGYNLLTSQFGIKLELDDYGELLSDIKAEKLSNSEETKKIILAQDSLLHSSLQFNAISQLILAFTIFKKDIDYIISKGAIVILDTNTGRAMPDRRWDGGLHQAMEAKEGVKINQEDLTLAQISIQSYFLLYKHMSGMTGTAKEDETEFISVYSLPVIQIPIHKECKRINLNDSIYSTVQGKYRAVAETIEEINKTNQPVLVGTSSVDCSQLLSLILTSMKVKHVVLNAKNHEKESEIISNAGQLGSVTISTNMAGRGTDIKLSDETRELGGLVIIGTERNDSRRVDRQLEGRCARQGDPGISKFFVSLEDDLLAHFGDQKVLFRILSSVVTSDKGMEDSKLDWVIKKSQLKVNNTLSSIRNKVYTYDKIHSEYRNNYYSTRLELQDKADYDLKLLNPSSNIDPTNISYPPIDQIMSSSKILQNILDLYKEYFTIRLSDPTSIPSNSFIFTEIGIEKENLSKPETQDKLLSFILKEYKVRLANNNPYFTIKLDFQTIIMTYDYHWKDFLAEVEALQESIQLRTIGQKDPISEFRYEMSNLYSNFLDNVTNDICTKLFTKIPAQNQ